METHKLSFINIPLLEGTDRWMAAFRYVNGATIQNLWIYSGFFETSGENAAGLVGHNRGETTIDNCRRSTICLPVHTALQPARSAAPPTPIRSRCLTRMWLSPLP